MTNIAQETLLNAPSEAIAQPALAVVDRDNAKRHRRRRPPFRPRNRQLRLALAPSRTPESATGSALDLLAIATALAPDANVQCMPITDDVHRDTLVQPGDTVILNTRPAATLPLGVLMAVTVEGGPERLRRARDVGGGRCSLEAEDPATPPETVTSSNVRVIGTVLSIVRLQRNA